MKARIGRIRPLVSGRGGFLLIDVMVAVFLSAIVVVPLATCMQRAVEKTEVLAAAFGRLENFEDAAIHETIASAWCWGPKVESAVWRPGPEIDVSVGSSGSRNVVVGIWADGWLVGEWAATLGGVAPTVVGSWSALEGRELTIRARGASGTWGPPWRCVVPDEYGSTAVDPTVIEASSSPVTSFDDSLVVLHTACFGMPSVEVSWTESSDLQSAMGVVFFLPECGLGCCEVDVDGEQQSWYITEPRGFDVYF